MYDLKKGLLWVYFYYMDFLSIYLDKHLQIFTGLLEFYQVLTYINSS